MPPLSVEEAALAIYWLKNHKPPGGNGVTAELVNYRVDQLH